MLVRIKPDNHCMLIIALGLASVDARGRESIRPPPSLVVSVS